MRKYSIQDERAIRTDRAVREWTRSELLDKTQKERMLPELQVELRRTNVFLRFILFAFGLLLIGATVLLVALTFEIKEDLPIAILCFVSAACSLIIAEVLVERFHLYRFGIEEAAAISAAVLVTVGIAILLPKGFVGADKFTIEIALITASVAAFLVYLRFGYLYAAIVSLFCISLAPFGTDLSQPMQRIFAAGLLTVAFIVARLKAIENQNEFPGDEYRIIQAMAWLGIYASLNLHLASIGSIFFAPGLEGPPFYVFTYAAIWLLPPIGMILGVRDRDRALIDVNIVLSLVTLATNKAYLHMPRQTWDPILLGLLLVGTAVALRRWLSKGDRNGLTSARILLSDKRGVAAVATASAALHAGHPTPQAPTQPDRSFQGEGGRSGGAGASGSF
jgi:hypothetical protein